MLHACLISTSLVIFITVLIIWSKIIPPILSAGFLLEPITFIVRNLKLPGNISKRQSYWIEVSFMLRWVWRILLLFKINLIKLCQFIELLWDYFQGVLRLTCIWAWNISEQTIWRQQLYPWKSTWNKSYWPVDILIIGCDLLQTEEIQISSKLPQISLTTLQTRSKLLGNWNSANKLSPCIP